MSIFRVFCRDNASERLTHKQGLTKVLSRIVHKAKGGSRASLDPSVTPPSTNGSSSCLAPVVVVAQRDTCKAKANTTSSNVQPSVPAPIVIRYPPISSSPSSNTTSEGFSRPVSYESDDQAYSVSHLDEASPGDVDVSRDFSDSQCDSEVEDARTLTPEEMEARIIRSLINDTPTSAPINIGVNQFKILKELGRGATGKVLKVRDRVSKKHLALKVIKKGRDDWLPDQFILMEQQALVRNSGNRHALQLAASFHDSENFYLVMEIQTGGDLEQLLRSMIILPIELARFYAAELLVGLYEIHARGIMHRDIKPANLLIDEKGHLVISDFGFAKLFEVSGGTHPYGHNGPLSRAPYLAEGCCGTPEFLSPEMLKDAEYGFSVDYWAAGITIFEMLVGHTPWHRARDLDELVHGICRTQIPSYAVPRPARMLLLGMLDKNINCRPRYNQMITSAFFDGVDWDAVRTGRARPPRFTRKENKDRSVDMLGSIHFMHGETYSPCRDPYPWYTWVSDSMEEDHKQIPSRLRRCFMCLNRAQSLVCAAVHIPKRCTMRQARRRRSRFVIEDSDVPVRLAPDHLQDCVQVPTTTTEKELEVHLANHQFRVAEPATVMGSSSIGAKKTFRKWISCLLCRTPKTVSFEIVSPHDS